MRLNVIIVLPILKRSKRKLQMGRRSLRVRLPPDEWQQLRNSIKIQQKNQTNLSILITSMTFSFYMCWTPYAISSFLTMTGAPLPQWMDTVAFLFAKSGAVINPLLYIFFNKKVTTNIWIGLKAM